MLHDQSVAFSDIERMVRDQSVAFSDIERVLRDQSVAFSDIERVLRDQSERIVSSETAFAGIRAELRWLRERIDTTRSMNDVSEHLFESLLEYRRSASYAPLYSQEFPLVSVCIATYNRSALLTKRCLPSVLAQQYPNIETIVVGDGCTDDTEAAIQGLHDLRVRFVNLPERGQYPEDPRQRWMVAGTPAANLARSLATGDLITQLDDDDEFMPDRMGKLVGLLQDRQAELVWHPFLTEVAPGDWLVNEANDFEAGAVTTGSVLYRSWFRNVESDAEAYRYGEPGDWNRYRKLKYLGVRMQRHPDILLRHYREGQNV